MAKTIYFDLDGTLFDLYGEENWLEKLLSETKGLFQNLKTIFPKEEIHNVLNLLKENGYQLEVITWTPKNVSEKYIQIVEKEKELSLKEFHQFSKIHYLRYGTPKQKALIKRTKEMILVDDNLEVIQNWDTPKQRKSILADENLIENLLALVD